ncbi:class I SAM-dependent methyltransferase [Paenibacillus sp. Y412MC10]|uniref:class I SAM-dependent methyltransferase n=1 Tax=Geobacillus sp. (strain Y412MC10) TaxID=481743 RepID=UPI00119EDC30|nr:class I SAM-dependent methyltransferase [Paenibacillus sp. Y412MC10]
MSTQDPIYTNHSNMYDAMVSRQPDLYDIINTIRVFKNLDVLDLGAGAGRLSTVIAPEAKSLICTDISRPMLDILESKLQGMNGPLNWKTVVSDHRQLPIPDQSIDLVVSGWSICYLADTTDTHWEQNLEQIMAELQRVLRPNGTIIIFETMGTGYETPHPPEFLQPYYALLQDKYGFDHQWIRTDYDFGSTEEAIHHTEFFFGHELVDRILQNQWASVPECAGIWWKHF